MDNYWHLVYTLSFLNIMSKFTFIQIQVFIVITFERVLYVFLSSNSLREHLINVCQTYITHICLLLLFLFSAKDRSGSC